MNKNKILNISKKTFFDVFFMLILVVIASIILTYILPKGTFVQITNPDGSITTLYDHYMELADLNGINIFKGIFAPILVLFSNDGVTLICLSVFILCISGCFQVMSDTLGIKVFILKIVRRFKENKVILISLITLVFMCFGAFFGLFEEVLALLPIIIILTCSIGYDSFTGFLICIVATAFGFASAITNPFTVLIVSNILGTSPLDGLWYRIIVFLLMYGLLLLYILIHIKKIKKDPKKSPTYEHDLEKKIEEEDLESIENSKKIFRVYATFLSIVLLSIITITSIASLRGLIVVFLIVIFLVGGLLCGFLVEENKKQVLKSFLNGVVAALPTIVLILLASSIKYILEEGMIIATITNYISTLMSNHNSIVIVILIYLVILVLEFFISSSTAKAIFVMGILSCVNMDISNNTLTLTYLFADGYSNIFFPTSPVLLIGLSMIGMNYIGWMKKSKWLFVFNILIVLLLLVIATLIGY